MAGAQKTSDETSLPRAAGSPRVSSLEDYVGFRLRLAQVAVFSEFIEAFAAIDLRPAQFSALLMIAENPGHNQSEIAASLGIQRANFVSFIEKLGVRGLIERRAIDEIGRAHV